ncbi:toxin TcdB middle/N-terminal domain-containing protein [Psychroserpens sp.]
MNKGGTSEQVLRRPNGGGAVNSIGSDFQINLNKGTGGYAIPIELPDGYRSEAPKLALQYSSGSGHGEFGLGWSLGGLAINRDTRRGVPFYNETDNFILGDEVLLSMGDGIFRPAVDSTFQRVRRLDKGWEVTDRQGTRFMLGTKDQSQERHPDIAGENGALFWLLDRIIDTSGNETIFTYILDNNRRYLQHIEYAVYRVEIEYEIRPDIYTSRRGGFPRASSLRGNRIVLHNLDLQPSLLRDYKLTYHQNILANHSLLASVTLTGFLFEPEEHEEQAPSLQFDYTRFEPHRRKLHSFTAEADGPPALNSATVDLIDLEGFGLPGVIEANQFTHRYWPNRGNGRWGIPQKLKAFPQGASLADTRVRFGDMNGNSRADLLVSSGSLTGYYPGKKGLEWGSMQRYSNNRPTFDARNRQTRMLDANGNGQVDALVADNGNFLLYEGKGAEGWEPLPRPIPRRRNKATHPDVSFNDPRVRLADMTGDGLIDMVKIYAKHIEIWPSLGSGKWDKRQTLILSGEGPKRFIPSQCFLADISGDGFTDVIYVDNDATYVWVNQCGSALALSEVIRYAPVASASSVRTVDMLGTRTAGLLFGLSYRAGHREPYRFLDFTNGTKPYLLNHIDNGVGGITDINYGSSTQHRQRDADLGKDWSTFLPTAIQVVDSISRTDSITGKIHNLNHKYHHGHYDSDHRQFVGFGQVEVEESHGIETTSSLTKYYFHSGQPNEVPELSAVHTNALRGLLYRKEIYGLDNTEEMSKPYVVESTTWNVNVVAINEDGDGILFPHPKRKEVNRYERTNQSNLLITELLHDDFGNIKLERRLSQSSNSVEAHKIIEIHGAYINDESRWILGLPLRRTVTSAGERKSETRFYYDELPEGEINSGLLTRRERLAFTAPMLNSIFAETEKPELETLGYHQRLGESGDLEYWIDDYHVVNNDNGTVREYHDPMGMITEINYDQVNKLNPIRITNPVGHVFQANYHPRLGSITSMTDPNDNITTYIYSPLGRIITEVRPGDTINLPTVKFEYKTNSLPISTIMTRRRETGEVTTQWSVSYYDGHGNVLETRSKLDDGNFQVSSRELFDLRSLVIARYPNFQSSSSNFDLIEGPSEPYMQLKYDPLKRLLEAVDAAGQISSADIGVDTFTYFDHQDNDATSPFVNSPRKQQIDPYGRLAAIIEETGSSTQTTEYKYSDTDNLIEIKDASATVLLQQTFDMLGRKLKVVHRDAGERRYLQDARGKLALYIDPQDRSITNRFDSIGRKIGVDFDNIEKEKFIYDVGAGSNLLGKLAKATDHLGSQSFSYDSRGRTTESKRVINGIVAPFVYTFSYDSDDRRRQTIYPDKTIIKYSFDTIGRLTGVSGLIDNVLYDAQGRREHVEYASGFEAHFQYEALLGRLEEHKLSNLLTNESLFHQGFSYDSAGNIIAIDDMRTLGMGVNLNNRHFEYDALSRLTRVQGGPNNNSYDHHYNFDAIGNMTLNESARPEPLWHDGAQIRGFSDNNGQQSLYEYDTNGCMQVRPGMTMTFDRRDMLERVVRDDGMEIEYSYDYRGRRIRKRIHNPDGSTQDTIYLGESFEVSADGTTIKYISDPQGSATLVVRQNEDSQVLHHDYLGNTILVRNLTTGDAHEIHYLPYGEILNPSDAIGQILFAAKRFDSETGLYYFRMRYYDPSIGRFISPDPIAIANAEEGILRPLSLNPYVFVLDNPLRYTDSNGLWTFWEGVLTVLIVAAVVVATAFTFGAAGVIALAVGAAVGGLVGGLTTGSVDGALAGAMLGFGIVATVLSAGLVGGAIGGLFGGAALGTAIGTGIGVGLGVIQALGFIPGVRQNDTYKDILGFSSWLNPWAWPGHVVGAGILLINALGSLFGGESIDVTFEHGMIVTQGGIIEPPRAFNNGNFTNLNSNISNSIRDDVLRHERGHSLTNAYFGILSWGNQFDPQADSFWEQMAESNVNPFVPGLTGGKDTRRSSGGRGFGDIPWWES